MKYTSTTSYISLLVLVLIVNIGSYAQGVEILDDGSITNVSAPTADQDAIPKVYVDDLFMKLAISFGAKGIQHLLDIGHEPLDLIASGVPIDSLYGRTYQGGLIFYLDVLDSLPNVKGMVAAPADQSIAAIWGRDETDISGAEGTAIGTGSPNTAAIVSECPEPGIAAKICDDLVLNDHTDWFLPSRDELDLIWDNLADSDGDDFNSGPTDPGNLGGFAISFYWSSSEIDDGKALSQSFSVGNQTTDFKDSLNRVRAIRAF